MDTPGPAPTLPGHGFALVLGGVVAAVWLGAMALTLGDAQLPAEADGTVLAVFPPGSSDEAMFSAVVRAGGEPLRSTWVGFAWVARGTEAGFAGRLRDQGARAVFGDLPVGPVLGGCAVVSADTKRPGVYDLRP